MGMVRSISTVSGTFSSQCVASAAAALAAAGCVPNRRHPPRCVCALARGPSCIVRVMHCQLRILSHISNTTSTSMTAAAAAARGAATTAMQHCVHRRCVLLPPAARRHAVVAASSGATAQCASSSSRAGRASSSRLVCSAVGAGVSLAHPRSARSWFSQQQHQHEPKQQHSLSTAFTQASSSSARYSVVSGAACAVCLARGCGCECVRTAVGGPSTAQRCMSVAAH
jgi:hypothetical protein